METEELKLKVEAYREELSIKTEQVTDLRVKLTLVSRENEFLKAQNEELKRVALEAEGSTATEAGTDNSNDAD